MSPTPAAAPSRRTAAPVRGRGLSSVRPPRRLSGPVSGRRSGPPGPGSRLPRPLGAFARGLARLSRHPLVERVIGGRWSIAVIAFALIGIVTLQLGLLKLNVGVGRSLERERTLERENATLGIENAELASPERIRQLATRMGMSPVALTQMRFLRSSHDPGAAAGAAARLHAPVHPAGEAEARSSDLASSEASGGEGSGTEEASSSEASGGEASGGEASGSEASGSEASGAESSGSEAEASPGATAETGEGG